MTANTAQRVAVERLTAKWREMSDAETRHYNYSGVQAFAICADELDEALPALLLQVAEQAAEIERLRAQFAPQPMDAVELIVGERDDVALTITTTVGDVRRYRAAERAREEACRMIAELRDYVVNERDAQVLPRKAASYQRELDSIDAFLAANGQKT